ncbi:hypothetical protein [Aliivibrio fischeri]|uniref:Uncharacterized protein n=1 Tax=Aliivibrio fischeri TaxID=668 RepID=A0A844P650_ALIFS|nr:hypothetical protein [Aliivibrio fischeri]MUK50778.1 hypothetical protein [Aliivibrio fischeri]
MKKIKSKRIKKEKTYKLIDRIINPIVPSSERIDAKVREFYNFTHNYSYDNFEQVFQIVARDEDIKSKLGFFQIERKYLLNATLFNLSDLGMEKILSILRVIFDNNIDEIVEFSKHSEEIELLLSTNKTKEVIDKLDYLDNKYRTTLWSINLRILCLSLDGCDTDELLYICKQYYDVNDSELLEDVLECIVGRNMVSDVISHIKTKENSKIKELSEGNAKAFSAFFSLVSGINCVESEVLSSYAVPVFLMLPLYDAYRFLIKSISNDFINDSVDFSTELKELLKDYVNSLKDYQDLHDLGKLKKLVNGDDQTITQSDVCSDQDYINYCCGHFDKVVDSFERNLLDDKNTISKLNLIAKSYIKSNRVLNPSIPKFLYDIINNLIRIYSLNNSNQCIRNILSLAYRVNQLEISYHLVVSIIKSAPYYFNQDVFDVVCRSSSLSILPITALTLNMQEKFILQNYLESSEKSDYLNIKESLWLLLKDNSDDIKGIENYLEQINNNTPITKDFLELKFEYYLQYEKYGEAIILASQQLTKNRESVFCIPMYKLAELIETGEYVGIDSVIVAHFFESEHRMQSEDLLKDAFEEYLISNDDRTPSQILHEIENLTEIELFFFQTVCSTKLISYQGIYGTASELSMERLRILNLLSNRDISDKDIITELVRDCMDEIIIAEGLTRISNSRINIRISELTNSILDEIESLISSYMEAANNDENEIYPLKSTDDYLFVKGEKYNVIKKIFNTIRLEFLDNPDYGLDKILSSRIRHSFFSDEICRKSIDKKLVVEVDKNGNFESRDFWNDKYHFISDHILKDINKILDEFNSSFYALIERAESWMKISKSGDVNESEFDFTFSIDVAYFVEVEKRIVDGHSPQSICEYVFELYKKFLLEKLDSMRVKLMETFCNEMDVLFVRLISDIESVKRGVAFSELFSAIYDVKNGIKEDIKTSSDWFSIDDKHYEEQAIEISKLLKISELFLERSSGQKRHLELKINYDYLVPSHHTSLVNLSIINLLSNAFKYAKKETTVIVKVEPFGQNGFIVIISNALESAEIDILKNGKLDEIKETLTNKNSLELLKTEGGTGIFKSLYELKLADDNYDLSINIDLDRFNVEVTYDE